MQIDLNISAVSARGIERCFYGSRVILVQLLSFSRCCILR